MKKPRFGVKASAYTGQHNDARQVAARIDSDLIHERGVYKAQLAAALDALRQAREALKKADAQVCRHEETHRGGVIWEICDLCGMEWSDDRNPRKPSKLIPLYEESLAAIDAVLGGEPR